MLLRRSDLDLVGVAVQRHFQLSEGRGLDLVCVLKLLDPVGFFALETRHLALDLHALVVLLVDAADELGPLLLALNLCLHVAHLEALLLLVADHLLHRLGFQFLGVLLDRNHLLVLLTLLFLELGFTEVALGLAHLLVTDGFLLLGARHRVPHLLLVLLMGSLLREAHLLVEVVLVALADANDITGFLFGFLNFFPGLKVITDRASSLLSSLPA